MNDPLAPIVTRRTTTVTRKMEELEELEWEPQSIIYCAVSLA